MVKIYKRKIKTVEAMQFTGTRESFLELRAWIGDTFYYDYQEQPTVFLSHSDGTEGVVVGNWIVLDPNIDPDEFVIMRDDQFKKAYEECN